MKKKVERMLKAAFEAPQPVRKKEFVKRFSNSYTRIGNFEFMLIQASYIRKWFWLISFFILAAALVGAFGLKKDVLWVISSLLPFAALAAVAENVRSVTYNMAELEMTSRFSLKSVVLARMGIIGAAHFFLLCLLLPLGKRYSTLPFGETVVYMMLPYLAGIVSGLWVTRKLRGREAVYACTGLAVMISGGNFIMTSTTCFFYEHAYFQRCLLVLVVLIVWLVRECRESIAGTEELA